MAEPFQLTENSHKVAVQLADGWATAVATQARRISAPQSTWPSGLAVSENCQSIIDGLT